MLGPTERWRWIKGHEGRYEVSDLGRVRSWRTSRRGEPGPRILKQATVRGYKQVSLGHPHYGGGIGRVHKLVLEAFVGAAPDGMECRHDDGDRGNNALANLSWGTCQENATDKLRHGTQVRGESQGLAKLSEAAIDAIRTSTLSQRKLAKQYGVTQATVWAVRQGKTWKHMRSIEEVRTDGHEPDASVRVGS